MCPDGGVRSRKLRLAVKLFLPSNNVTIPDEVFAADIEHLQRPISQAVLDQVWITTSGIFTEPPFLAALLTFGIDRIMFSVDYPYAPNAKGRAFLDRIAVSPVDMEKLAWRNAARLLKLGA